MYINLQCAEFFFDENLSGNFVKWEKHILLELNKYVCMTFSPLKPTYMLRFIFI